MENVSKALYMAAGVLVGILILSMFVYLFRAGASFGEKYVEKQSQGQLQLFNSKFEHYNKDCSNPENINTIVDMITVTNLAINTNEENDFNTQHTVEIKINISSSTQLRVSASDSLERNYLFVKDTDDKIYVYDLLSKGKDLAGISLIPIYNKDLDSTVGTLSLPSIVSNGENLSIVNEDMKYKFWFKCTSLKYHEISGRVKSMEFEIMKSIEEDEAGNLIWP